VGQLGWVDSRIEYTAALCGMELCHGRINEVPTPFATESKKIEVLLKVCNRRLEVEDQISTQKSVHNVTSDVSPRENE